MAVQSWTAINLYIIMNNLQNVLQLSKDDKHLFIIYKNCTYSI